MARINKKEQQIINQGGSLDDIKNRLDRKPLISPDVPSQYDDTGSRDYCECNTNSSAGWNYTCVGMGNDTPVCLESIDGNGPVLNGNSWCQEDLLTNKDGMCYSIEEACDIANSVGGITDIGGGYSIDCPDFWFEQNAWTGVHVDPYAGFNNDDYFIHDFSGVGYNYGSEIPDFEDCTITIIEGPTTTDGPEDGYAIEDYEPGDPSIHYELLIEGTHQNDNIRIINLAILDASNRGGGTVCLPEGTFIITSTDEYQMITLKNNVVLKGRVDEDTGRPTTYLYFYGGILSDDEYYSYLDDSGPFDINEVSKIPYIGTAGGADVVLEEINYEPDIIVGTNILTISDNHNIQIGDLLLIQIEDDSYEFIQGYNYFFDAELTEEVNEFITEIGGESGWAAGTPILKYYRKVIGITDQYIILDLPHRIAVCDGTCGFNKTTISIVDVHFKNNNIGIMNLFISNAVDTHHFNKFIHVDDRIEQIALSGAYHIIYFRRTINSFIKNVHTVPPINMGLPINTSPEIEQTCQFYDVGKPIPDTVPPFYYIGNAEPVRDYFTGVVTNYVDTAAKILRYYDDYGVDKHTDCYNLEDASGREACCNVIFDVLDNDVRFFNDKQNVLPESKQLLRHGIAISLSSNITVENTTMALPQVRGGGGEGYMFLVTTSSDILFKECAGYRGRHNFSTTGRCSGIVYSKIISANGWGNNVYGDTQGTGQFANINNSTTDWWSRYMQSEFLLMHGNPSLSDTHTRVDLVQLVTESWLHDGWKTLNRGTNSSGQGITSDEFYFWNIFGVSRDEFTWQEFNNPSLLMNHQARKGYIYGTTNMHVSEVSDPEDDYPYPYEDFLGTLGAKPMIEFTSNPSDYTQMQPGDWFNIAVDFFMENLVNPIQEQIFNDDFVENYVYPFMPVCENCSGCNDCNTTPCFCSREDTDNASASHDGYYAWGDNSDRIDGPLLVLSDVIYEDDVLWFDTIFRMVISELSINGLEPFVGSANFNDGIMTLDMNFNIDSISFRVDGKVGTGVWVDLTDCTYTVPNISFDNTYYLHMGGPADKLCSEVPLVDCGLEELGYDYCEKIGESPNQTCQHIVEIEGTGNIEYDADLLDYSGDCGLDVWPNDPDSMWWRFWGDGWFQPPEELPQEQYFNQALTDHIAEYAIPEKIQEILSSTAIDLFKGFVYSNETKYAYFTEPALTDKIQQPNPDTSFNNNAVTFLEEDYRNLFEYQQQQNATHLNFIRGPVLGDVNIDGVVNVQDIQLVVQQILGNASLNEFQQSLADVHQDGLINVQDILQIVNQALGITPQQQSAIMNQVKRLLQPVTK